VKQGAGGSSPMSAVEEINPQKINPQKIES